MRRADRLFSIVQILRRDRITTAARLGRELGVSERTVYRDLADLSRSGVPIEGEAGVGYRLPKSFELPPLMFTADEVEALVTGMRMAQSWTGAELSAAAAAALRKIESVLPSALSSRLGTPGLFAPDFHIPKEASRHLDELRRAVRDRRKILASYTRADGEASERVLRPLGLFFWGPGWSLSAWCELRASFRSFRLDRFNSVATLPETFADEPGRTLADYLRILDAEIACNEGAAKVS